MIKIFLVALIGLFIGQNVFANPITFTDLAGRKVQLKAPVSRFVMSEGRYLTALSMLQPEDPSKGVVGLMTTLGWTHPELQEKLYQKFPKAKDIAIFGANGAESVSVEKILDLEPQVAILGLSDHGPNTRARELISLLESAGVEIVFIDFRLNPLKNTVPSLNILGKILGQEERANAFIEDYSARLENIRSKVRQIETRPSVFLQVHAGRRKCCWGMADGMLGPFVEFAGGRNIADAVAPGPTSLHTHEFLLTENPDVWVGTASGTVSEFERGGLPVTLGAGMSEQNAQLSLKQYLKSDEFQAMKSVQNSRAHAFWHNFYNSPFNIVVLEALAKWIHPDVFTSLDPQQSLQNLYDKFMPFELDGEYFVTYRHDK